MADYEGKWDCAQCLTKGIPGTVLACPTCGDPHNESLDPSESWYLPENARTLTNEESELAESGPVWNCGKCNHPNPGDALFCQNCEEPRDSDDFVSRVTRYVEGVDANGATLSTREQLETDWVDTTLRRSDELQALEDGPVTSPVRTLPGSEIPRVGISQYDNGGWGTTTATASHRTLINHPVVVSLRDRLGPRAKLIVIGAFVLIMTGTIGTGIKLYYDNYVATTTVSLQVQELSWEREVEVEEFRTLTQEGWNVPNDGRVLSSRREIRSYKRVLDHYETRTRQVPETKQTGTRSETYACGSTTVNNGNGTFSSRTTYCQRMVPVYTTTYRTETYQEPVYRNDPVYDTKYTFEVDRWVTDHFSRAEGTIAPYWPEPTISGSKQRIGDERHETYEVVLEDEQSRTFDREVKLSIWEDLTIDTVVEGEQTRKGTLKDINWQLAA